MLKLLFLLLMFMVFGKILIFAVRATWGIAKIVFTVIFLPLFLIGLLLKGLLMLAFIILIVAGCIAFFGLRD